VKPNELINDLLNFIPSVGNHEAESGELCAMEYVAFLAGEKHSDQPQCACPVISEYVRELNDKMPDKWRYKLRGYLLRLIGNRAHDNEQARAEYLAFQVGRVFVPIAFRTAGPVDHAKAIEGAKSISELLDAADATSKAARVAGEAALAAWFANHPDEAAIETAMHAARAAAEAAWFAPDEVWQASLNALDGVLAIGRQAEEAPRDLERRIHAVNELMSA